MRIYIFYPDYPDYHSFINLSVILEFSWFRIVNHFTTTYFTHHFLLVLLVFKMDGDKLATVAELMDQFLLEQNYKLILENCDQERDIIEQEQANLTLRQQLDDREEYSDQVVAENAVLMDQLNRLQRQYNELMRDFNRQVERNISMERRIRRLETGDDLFFGSDTDTDEEVDEYRNVRRRLDFEL